HDVRQAHRAELLQRRDPGIGCPRRDTTLHTNGNLTTMMLLEILDTRRLRPTPQAADGHHAVLFCQIDNDGRHPCQIDHVDLQHACTKSRRHPGINGISPAVQEALCCQRRQVMPRCDHSFHTHHSRTIRPCNRQLTHAFPFICVHPRLSAAPTSLWHT